jgi:hypothetical protein
MYSLYLTHYASELYTHHTVVVRIHKKKYILGKWLWFTDTKYDILIIKGKGKAIPLQAWSGPDCSRNLRFPDYMTTAQDGGKVVGLTHRPPLPPRNAPGTHFF